MKVLLLLLAATVAKGDDLDSAYAGKFDGLEGLTLYYRTTSTHLEIALKTLVPGGWVGFGLAEPSVGGMKGSDMVMASVLPDGTVWVSDRHAKDYGTPLKDCSQDWEAVSGSYSASEGMTVELRRALVTNDGEDRPVEYGVDNIGLPFRTILAHSAAFDSNTREPAYHASNRVAVKLNLLNPGVDMDNVAHLRNVTSIFTVDMLPSNALWIDGGFGGGGSSRDSSKGLAVPTETSGGSGYIDMCFSADDLLPPLAEKSDSDPTKPYHIVGFEHVIDKETEEFVHHFTVTGYYGSNDCRGEGRGTFLFGWAPGVDSTPLPAEAGFPLANTEADLSGRRRTQEDDSLCAGLCKPAAMCYKGGCDGETGQFFQAANKAGCNQAKGVCDICYPESPCGSTGNEPKSARAFRSIKMQVHYDNPSRKRGHFDNSGMRLFVSVVPREHELAVLQLGDGSLRNMGKSIPKGASRMTVECPAECTSKLSGPIHVFTEQLHLHQTGAQMRTETIRGGEVVSDGSTAPREASYYNFGFQDAIRRSFDIMPGDALRTSCTYRHDDDVKFGLGSWDEMCISFVSYWPADPALDSGYCGAEGGCGGRVVNKIHSIPDDEFAASATWPKASSLENATECHAEVEMKEAKDSVESEGDTEDTGAGEGDEPEAGEQGDGAALQAENKAQNQTSTAGEENTEDTNSALAEDSEVISAVSPRGPVAHGLLSTLVVAVLLNALP